jgi:hypothetical protein
VAEEAGDVVLVRNDPRDVARIVELSRATYRKMVQNLWWAAGYNIVRFRWQPACWPHGVSCWHLRSQPCSCPPAL